MSNKSCVETTMGGEEEDLELALSLQSLFKEEEKEDETEFLQGLVKVEEIIGYEFKDKKLLSEALTDKSYNKESYERLEYLGDAVLNFKITEEGFIKYPKLKPGKLTLLRAANVENEKLARVAIYHGLHNYVRHKRPLLADQIQEFITEMAEYPVHSNGLIDSPKLLADIVESTIGAIYLDTGRSLDCTWKIVEPLLTPIITPETLQVHPVTKLNELCQKKGYEIERKFYSENGGMVVYYIDKVLMGSCLYLAKKAIAWNRAADKAYQEIMKRINSLGESA